MVTGRKVNIEQAQVRVTETRAPPLSFFQRWFCRPVPNAQALPTEPTDLTTPLKKEGLDWRGCGDAPVRPRLEFSFFSKGALLVGAASTMIIIIILTIVLALTLGSHARHTRLRLPTSSSNGYSDPAFAYTTPPIRLAVLANFPDPSIYYVSREKMWYAFGTNNAAGILSSSGTQTHSSLANLQIATSTDFKSWTLKPPSSDPLPNLGDWVMNANLTVSTFVSLPLLMPNNRLVQNLNSYQYKGTNDSAEVALANVWAPDVIQHPTSGKYLLYYSARSANGPVHCIGAAVADGPAGPFNPMPEPLSCPIEKGGAIDASGFVDDDGSIYVVHKVDGNSKGHGGECNNGVSPQAPTPIILQKMGPDGVTPDPSLSPIEIFDRTAQDGPLVEAPQIVKSGNSYFLFYSSGCTRNMDYTVRYAFAPKITGPYTRPGNTTLLKTGEYGLYAPGSVSVRWAQDANQGETHGGNRLKPAQGSWKIALHGRVQDSEGGVRPMFTAGLAFDGQSVRIVDGALSVT